MRGRPRAEPPPRPATAPPVGGPPGPRAKPPTSEEFAQSVKGSSPYRNVAQSPSIDCSSKDPPPNGVADPHVVDRAVDLELGPRPLVERVEEHDGLAAEHDAAARRRRWVGRRRRGGRPIGGPVESVRRWGRPWVHRSAARSERARAGIENGSRPVNTGSGLIVSLGEAEGSSLPPPPGDEVIVGRTGTAPSSPPPERLLNRKKATSRNPRIPASDHQRAAIAWGQRHGSGTFRRCCHRPWSAPAPNRARR